MEGFHLLCTAASISHSARTESGSAFSSVKDTWKPNEEIISRRTTTGFAQNF